MHPVYHAKTTVSTKNFPRSEGRKCGVKGLVQWHGLMVWSRSRFWTTKGRERVRVSGILEFTTLDDEILGPFDGLFRRFRRLLPTYSRGPFIRSVQNIANRYCTECIIGIVQNAGTPSRLRFGIESDSLIPGGHNYQDLRISDVKINVANAAQAVPDAVRNAPRR